MKRLFDVFCTLWMSLRRLRDIFCNDETAMFRNPEEVFSLFIQKDKQINWKASKYISHVSSFFISQYEIWHFGLSISNFFFSDFNDKVVYYW